jgi:hypothetical protein
MGEEMFSSWHTIRRLIVNTWRVAAPVVVLLYLVVISILVLIIGHALNFIGDKGTPESVYTFYFNFVYVPTLVLLLVLIGAAFITIFCLVNSWLAK